MSGEDWFPVGSRNETVPRDLTSLTPLPTGDLGIEDDTSHVILTSRLKDDANFFTTKSDRSIPILSTAARRF